MEQGKKSGDANQITREYMDSLLIELRYIDAVIPNTELVLYGERFATPIMTAALSHLGKEMVELAKGALSANAVMWCGMGDEEELARITATGARTIKIIKPYADEGRIYEQLEQAQKCGALAVGMDIDHSFNGTGGYDNVLGDQMKGKTLKDLSKYVGATKLPFILKGVLSRQDAHRAVEAGMQGIVVSHHHGIQDFAVPPLLVLPEIAGEINHRIPIFVDCGIQSGIDVFKALALGAQAVCVGRELMEPAKAQGALGVQKRIEEMTREMAAAMARTCSPDIGGIEPSVIRKRNW